MVKRNGFASRLLKLFCFMRETMFHSRRFLCYTHSHENDGEKAWREGRAVHPGRAALGARREGEGLRGGALRLDRAVGVGRRARLPPLPRPRDARARLHLRRLHLPRQRRTRLRVQARRGRAEVHRAAVPQVRVRPAAADVSRRLNLKLQELKMSSKTFKCKACRTASETLHMRNSDGKWVCVRCIPAAELDACAGLRERLGLKPAAARVPRRKAA